jgi:integrase
VTHGSIVRKVATMVGSTSALHAKKTFVPDQRKLKNGHTFFIRQRIEQTDGRFTTMILHRFDNKDDRDLKLLEYKTGKIKIKHVSQISIAQAGEDFVAHDKKIRIKKGKTRGKNYYSNKRTIVKCFIDANNNELLADIDIRMFNKLIRHLNSNEKDDNHKHNMHAKNAKKRIGDFKTVYNKMCSLNDINPIVITGLDFSDFRDEDSEPRYALNPEQVKRMFKQMEDDQWPYRFLFMFWLEFGFRPSELHGLRWTDIQNGSIHLQESLQHADGEAGLESYTWRWKDLKTERKGHRYLGLTSKAQEYLDKHCQEDERLRSKYAKEYEQHEQDLRTLIADRLTANGHERPAEEAVALVHKYNGLIFTRMPNTKFEQVHNAEHTSTYGWPLEDRVINDGLKIYANQLADIPEDEDITQYNLRHSALMILASKGLTREELKSISGHTTDASLDVYIKRNTDAIKRELAESVLKRREALTV